jgi:hypothetical protein
MKASGIRTGAKAPDRRVAVLCAFTVALALFVLAGCGGKKADFTGYWQGGPENGDLVIRIDRSGDAYTIVGLGAPMPATLDQGKLTADMTPEQLVLTLSADGKTLTAAWDVGTSTMTRPVGSDAELAQQIEMQANRGNDAAVKESMHTLQVGIQSWAVDHNDVYPSVRVVQPSNKKFASYTDSWPVNPFTKVPMAPGTQPGDYTYSPTSDSYSLSGHLFDGSDYTVP